MSEKKQTVLLVHNYYRIPGGEDTVVANERALLEKQGHTVCLYTRNNAEIQDTGILSKIRLACTSVFSLKTYKEVKRLIRDKQIDIVHVHNTLSLISPSVYYAAFSCKVPVVQTLHNFRMVCPNGLLFREGTVCEECIEKGLGCSLRHKCYRDSFLQTFVSLAILKIHRFLGTYRKINYIALTEFNKKKIAEGNKKKNFIPLDKIYVKPNFVKPFPVENIERAEKQFLYVGRLEKEKGIPFLLEAWKDLPEYTLELCGTGTLEAWCRDYIAKHELCNVKLLGQQTQNVVRQKMAQATAVVFPSQWYEGMSMVLLESMAMGTPILASDIGNGGDMIVDGINGTTFVPDSIKNFLEKVKSFSGYDVEMIRKHFKEHYSEEVNYRLLKQIYDTCCERK